MCLGTLASAAVFIRERTNFILLAIFGHPTSKINLKKRAREISEARLMKNLLEHLLALTVCSAARETLLKANRRARWAATSQWVDAKSSGSCRRKVVNNLRTAACV